MREAGPEARLSFPPAIEGRIERKPFFKSPHPSFRIANPSPEPHDEAEEMID